MAKRSCDDIKITELPPQDYTTKENYNAGITGLAFSGGGIRSAALCSGVLRRMLQNNVHIDYLSCVSGGGYTGTAYLDWKFRNGKMDNPEWHKVLYSGTILFKGEPQSVPITRQYSFTHLQNPASKTLSNKVSEDLWRVDLVCDVTSQKMLQVTLLQVTCFIFAKALTIIVQGKNPCQ